MRLKLNLRLKILFFVLFAFIVFGNSSCANIKDSNPSESSEDESSIAEATKIDTTSDAKREGFTSSSRIAKNFEGKSNLRILDKGMLSLSRELEGTGIQQVVVDANGFTFDALVTGSSDGIPVMLLHGFPSTSYQWRSQMVALGNAGYYVFAPNQRGYSSLARPTEIADYATDFLVEDVEQLAAALGWNKFHLIGHDWGAFVAWSYGATHSAKLYSLTPISVPHPEAFAIALSDPSGEQASMSSYMDFFRQSDSELAFLANNAELLKGIYQDAGLSKTEMEPYFEVLGTPEALSSALNWYRANDFAPELLEDAERRSDIADISIPTMHVWSSEDTALGRQGAELTSNFVTGDYRFEVIEGVNHWVTEVASEQLNTILLDFLSQYSPDYGS